MFDIVLASSPGTLFSGKLAAALRTARMRVVVCDVAPLRPPPSALRVDAAVACAPTPPLVVDIARSVRSALDGPPPVVGVSGGPIPPAAGELTQSLTEDVPAPVLVGHVQRAAAQTERRRSRVVMRGELDDVGLENLLASLTARGRSCFVRIREGARRAEITLDAGRVVHVRADGVDASRDRAGAFRVVSSWLGATFEVISSDPSPGLRSTVQTDRPPPSSAPSSAPVATGSAGDVALAAAVLNACAAYGRAFLGPEKAASLLAASWSRVRVDRPALEAFAVSREGVVSVVQVDRARAAVPEAIAVWLETFFDEAAAVDPVRFRRVRLREVLGGLTRLVEQVGWASSLLEASHTKESAIHE